MGRANKKELEYEYVHLDEHGKAIDKNKLEKVYAEDKAAFLSMQYDSAKANELFEKINQMHVKRYGKIVRRLKYPFGYNFTENQIGVLTNIFNLYISAMPFQITTKQMETILNTQEYIGFIRVKNNRVLSFLFNELATQGMVCNNWQEVIEKNGLFKSKTGNTLTAKSLSVALARYKGDELQRDFIKEPMIEPYKTIKEMLSNL